MTAAAAAPVRVPTDAVRAGPAARIAAGLLGGVAAFQVALVAGAPWGAAAWGGAFPGVLPVGMRLASAASTAVYLLLTVALVSPAVPATRRRQVLAVATVFLAVGAVLNLVSPSGVERAIWTPVSAALAVLLWLARRDGSGRP